jgi:hypothetical protein
MNEQTALAVILEIVNRCPKNQAEMAGVQAALDFVIKAFRELEATKTPSKEEKPQ